LILMGITQCIFAQGETIVSPVGAWVVPPKYDAVFDFHNGLARIQRHGLWGFIDRTGKEVIPPKYDEVGVLKNSEFSTPASHAAIFLTIRWFPLALRGRGWFSHPMRQILTSCREIAWNTPKSARARARNRATRFRLIAAPVR